MSTLAIERAPTLARLTDMQFAVALLLGLNRNYVEIARELSIEPSTVKYHAEEAARKIPGDLPAQAKLAVWVRGGTLDVLEGRSLKVYVFTAGTSRLKRPPLVADGAVTASA